MGEKKLYWMASSRKDLNKLPVEVQRVFGYAIHLAQNGSQHLEAKPFKGVGGGVPEVVEDHDSDTYRAVYSVKFREAVFVLHVFKKKSKKGRETPKADVDLIKSRLKLAQELYDLLKKKGEL
ncbi:MAG: type II toxin-antitoxin system RelE/ParE family toxin [Mariprofundaceae bacterium]|nr:type II toxin-antitoxin system RelE/ParE family toxin [Mariprofundaceae bacterium]